MKRSSLAAATVAALAATALGTCTPAALADVAAHPHGPSRPHGTPAAASEQLRHAQRRVQHEIAQKEAELDRLVGSRRLSRLGQDDATAVRASLAADRAALAALGDQLPAATTAADVLAIATQVRALRPEVYGLVATDLRRAAAARAEVVDLETVVTELGTVLDTLEAAGVDVSALRAALDAVVQACDLATTSATDATALARALTAASSRDDVHAVAAALAASGDALDVAHEQLAAVRSATTGD